MSATIDSNSSPTDPDSVLQQWDSWCQHLESRQSPCPPTDLFHCDSARFLQWGLPVALDPADLERFNKTTRSGGSSQFWAAKLDTWIAAGVSAPPTLKFAYDCLAWCHHLPRLSQLLPANAWTDLLENLVDLADTGQDLSALDHPLPYTLLAGELGLTLNYLFPELDSCRSLYEPSCDALATSLVDLVDGEGLPHASDIAIFRALLASWARCDKMSTSTGTSCFNDDAHAQLEWAVRLAVLLTRKDGSQLFTPPVPDKSWHRCCAVALELAGDEVDWYLASRAILKLQQRTAHHREFVNVEPANLPPLAIHSEWSELTIMRTGRDRPQQQLALRYDQPIMNTELIHRGHSLLHGNWTTEVSVNGHALGTGNEWDVTCWFSDKDADYLELQIALNQDWKLQRQVLLAHKDNFLYLADAVLGSSPALIEYVSRLPLSSQAHFKSADKTHEGILHAGGHDTLVLPLACPEWRTEKSPGQLRENQDALEYRCQVNARNLYAPLFFDLSRAGVTKPFTWRRLTVAESLEIQSPEVATGYRVQIGSRQWFTYRSLDPPANRTILGQNLSNEFVFGRFDHRGEVNELVGIE
jgi:hypothetical protein